MSMVTTRQNLNIQTRLNREPKLSRTHAPADLSPVDWQRGLRRQFGREQAFGLENLTGEPFFSEFRISNPVSKSSYRVAIRGMGPGGNFCSCPDYATSELGTCKHIEFTLARLEKKRGAKTAFARGYQPAFFERGSVARRCCGATTVRLRSSAIASSATGFGLAAAIIDRSARHAERRDCPRHPLETFGFSLPEPKFRIHSPPAMSPQTIGSGHTSAHRAAICAPHRLS
jgi:hypothetical protein